MNVEIARRWRRRRRSSLAGEDASTSSGSPDSRIETGRGGRALSPRKRSPRSRRSPAGCRGSRASRSRASRALSCTGSGRTRRLAGVALDDRPRLVRQVMTKEPYASAHRVFWVVDTAPPTAAKQRSSACTTAGRTSSFSICRCTPVGSPDRDLLLDRPAQGPPAQRPRRSCRPRPQPQRVRAPLQRDRGALRLEVHARRPGHAGRPARRTRAATQAGGLSRWRKIRVMVEQYLRGRSSSTLPGGRPNKSRSAALVARRVRCPESAGSRSRPTRQQCGSSRSAASPAAGSLRSPSTMSMGSAGFGSSPPSGTRPAPGSRTAVPAEVDMARSPTSRGSIWRMVGGWPLLRGRSAPRR